MAYYSHVKKVEELLDKLLNQSLPDLAKESLAEDLPPLFKNGIKDMSVSITVGPVSLSFTLGGEDD
jgi:hypothetical protein